MKVNPSDPQNTPRTGRGSLRNLPSGVAARTDGKAGSPPGPAPVKGPQDNLEITAAARDLNEAIGTGKPPESSLRAGRLREISRRVAEGYYARPEVRETMLRRLAADLAASAPDDPLP